MFELGKPLKQFCNAAYGKYKFDKRSNFEINIGVIIVDYWFFYCTTIIFAFNQFNSNFY